MGKKILVIDDEPDILMVLANRLKLAGFDVENAETGEEGLMISLRSKPDLILLDLMLPGISGFEVLEKLKNQSGTRHIPVFVISAKSQLGDRDKAFKAGAAQFFVKPFNSSELLDKIREIVKPAKGGTHE